MKLKEIFFAMGLLALTTMSCGDNTARDEDEREVGTPAKITIRLTESNPASRAAGVTGSDGTVNNYTVFFFREKGDLDVAPVYVTSGTADLDATTLAKKVYIVTNTGPIADGPLAGVTSEANLKTKVGKLMTSTNVNTSTQTNTNLYMEGSGTITWDSGDNTAGTSTVALNFLASKINVTVDASGFKNGTGDNAVTFESLVLLYAGADGKFFETAANKMVQSTFYTGDASYPTFGGGATASTALLETIDVKPTGTVGAGSPLIDSDSYFYVFPNNGAAKATILAVKARSTASGTFYFPMRFVADASEANNIIEPGKVYNVTLNLNGDATVGGNGGGVEDPEYPVLPATIDVSVNVAFWSAPIIVSKEFN